jgi:hydroxymethylbilane synthase
VTGSAAVLRLGTRRSALARTQSTWVADRLRAQGYAVELVEILTEGDVNRSPLTQIGGTGVFASALRHALRDRVVDLAVHSLKDLPTAAEADLVIAAVPAREDPRDALCARDGLTLADLPAGSAVGTGSPRREAQLRQARPDLRIVALRGNVDTRLAAVRAGALDAVVLAVAGLTRLGRLDQASELLAPAIMLPAAGQGALAVECRADRTDVVAALAAVDDPDTRVAVTAERALLAALEAGCTAPIGALAIPREDVLELEGFRGPEEYGPIGRAGIRARTVGSRQEPVEIARRLAQQLAVGRAL